MFVRFVGLVHDERKLFYVCTHDVKSKTRLGWKNVASKAKAAYGNLIGGKSHNINGAIIAMVNTNYQGWRDEILPGEYNKENDEYVFYKKVIILEYEELGYTNVGQNLRVSNGKGPGTVPWNWNRKFNPATMTKDQIYKKIEFINRSLQAFIPTNVIHAAYLEIVTNRKTVPYEVDSMLTLLRFVRDKVVEEVRI